MHHIAINLPEIKLLGIIARTSNALEKDPSSAKIGTTMNKFFQNAMQDKIIQRTNPGRIFAVYTKYESDEHGEYTYFVGEEVDQFDSVDPELTTLTIPAQNYIKFTCDPGKMPAVVIDMWQKIWATDSIKLGGKRSYIADFEIYDERSKNPQQAILDVYIGIH